MGTQSGASRCPSRMGQRRAMPGVSARRRPEELALPGAVEGDGPAAFAAGMVILVAGAVLRGWSFYPLGRYFTAVIKVSPDQPVIASGPYRLLRHPSYAGGLLAEVGIAVTSANWASVAAFALAGVDQVGEGPAGAPGLPGELVRLVAGIGAGVVAADARHGQVRVARQQRAQHGLDVADIGTVVAQERDQQCGRGGEVVNACHHAAGVGEGETGRLRAERDHQ
ncbi:MAG: methyltransferase family protein [Streptosporangiaceae bacterium]